MYNRKILSNILKSLDSKEIVFLLGSRQVGKTTLTKLIAKNSNFKNIFFFDLEDKEYRKLFNDISVKTLKYILELEGINLNKKNLIIFDEIQLLDDPSNLLKLLHDHFSNLKIIATGSSSLQIKTKFSDSLSGRKKVFIINPLDFDEFLLFKGEDKLLRLRKLFFNEKDKLLLKPIIEANKKYFLSLFDEYITYGGYPEVVLKNSKEEKIEKLDSIVTSYIKKDIKDLIKIENIDGFNNLLQYLSINTSSLINISTIANTISLSMPTIKKYISILKETFIIDELKPFYKNKNKEISKNGKIFFKDIGVRNLQIKNFNQPFLRTDIGDIYENYVFNSLNDYNILTSLYLYRTQSKTEIDFIKINQNNATLYEVKSYTFKKIPKAMIEFEKKYLLEFKKIDKIVINKDYFDIKDNVLFLPIFLI